MDILVRNSDNICIAHGTITEVPERDMYFINEQKTHIQYIDLYTLVNDVTLPVDYADKKYLYVDPTGFELNPSYVEPIYLEVYVRENRDRIKDLEDDMATATDRILTLESDLSTANGSIATLEGQMSTAIAAIQDLQSRVSILEGT